MSNATQLPTLSVTPDWLNESSHSQQQPVESFLTPLPSRQELIEAEQYNFGIIFERALPEIENGTTLTTFLKMVKEREPLLDIDRFRRWIFKDDKRKADYYLAQEIGSEVLEHELIAIADATDNPMEDVQRSRLRYDVRKFLLTVRNQKRYGQKVENINSGTGGEVIINIGAVTPFSEKNVTTIEHDGVIDG